MRRRSTLMTAAAMLAAASLAVAGCGGGDDESAADTSTAAAVTASPETNETTPTTGETAAATASAVAVTLGSPEEFSLVAEPAEVPAGPTTFTVENKGALLHEMVVVPAPDGAEALKEANGEASEEGAPGEVADLPAGETGSITVTLPAGDYVLLCNLPGHFAGGMYTGFTVS